MNPPTSTTRFIGTPRNARVLSVGAALVVFAWLGGAVPWWLAITAACFIGTVRNAEREVRRYDAWWSEWQAMGGHVSPAAARPNRTSRLKLAFQAGACALVACVIWEMYPAGQEIPGGLALLWFVIVGCFFWKTGQLIKAALVASFARSARRSKAPPTAQKREDDVVAWVLPRASSSPSREDAMRNLPNYCARLVARE